MPEPISRTPRSAAVPLPGAGIAASAGSRNAQRSVRRFVRGMTGGTS
jgi:hypothetical protein